MWNFNLAPFVLFQLESVGAQRPEEQRMCMCLNTVVFAAVWICCTLFVASNIVHYKYVLIGTYLYIMYCIIPSKKYE